jgi:N4-gp56 family major capsid protein
MGVGVEAQTPIQVLPHLENDAGDTISYDLVMQLKMQPVEGDNTLEGKEEDLKFFTDSVSIDQLRGGVNTGGKMTRKRTIHDLRKVARVRQSEWWARVFDELFFIYLTGARGTNADYIFPTTYTGFAGNALVAPDNKHQLYGGAATAKANLAATDKADLTLIEKASRRPRPSAAARRAFRPSSRSASTARSTTSLCSTRSRSTTSARTRAPGSGSTCRRRSRRPWATSRRSSRAASATTTTS